MCVNSHLHKCLSVLCLLYRPAEISSHTKCAKVHISGCLCGILIQNEIRIVIVAGNSSSIFENDFSIIDFLHEFLLFCAPMAVYISKIQSFIWNMKLPTVQLFYLHNFCRLIFQHNETFHQVIRFVDFIMQFHYKGIMFVF